MAPAGSWATRLAETPGSLTRSAWDILGRRSASAATSACRRTRLTYGPSLDAAAPAILASWRKVFEVPTT